MAAGFHIKSLGFVDKSIITQDLRQESLDFSAYVHLSGGIHIK